MKIELEVKELITVFKTMTTDEKELFSNAIKEDEIVMKSVNEHLYEVLKARENLIKKREKQLNIGAGDIVVSQRDIDILESYINDCMDTVAFGNTDWNRSYQLALDCLKLHSID